MESTQTEGVYRKEKVTKRIHQAERLEHGLLKYSSLIG